MSERKLTKKEKKALIEQYVIAFHNLDLYTSETGNRLSTELKSNSSRRISKRKIRDLLKRNRQFFDEVRRIVNNDQANSDEILQAFKDNPPPSIVRENLISVEREAQIKAERDKEREVKKAEKKKQEETLRSKTAESLKKTRGEEPPKSTIRRERKLPPGSKKLPESKMRESISKISKEEGKVIQKLLEKKLPNQGSIVRGIVKILEGKQSIRDVLNHFGRGQGMALVSAMTSLLGTSLSPTTVSAIRALTPFVAGTLRNIWRSSAPIPSDTQFRINTAEMMDIGDNELRNRLLLRTTVARTVLREAKRRGDERITPRLMQNFNRIQRMILSRNLRNLAPGSQRVELINSLASKVENALRSSGDESLQQTMQEFSRSVSKLTEDSRKANIVENNPVLFRTANSTITRALGEIDVEDVKKILSEGGSPSVNASDIAIAASIDKAEQAGETPSREALELLASTLGKKYNETEVKNPEIKTTPAYRAILAGGLLGLSAVQLQRVLMGGSSLDFARSALVGLSGVLGSRVAQVGISRMPELQRLFSQSEFKRVLDNVTDRVIGDMSPVTRNVRRGAASLLRNVAVRAAKKAGATAETVKNAMNNAILAVRGQLSRFGTINISDISDMLERKFDTRLVPFIKRLVDKQKSEGKPITREALLTIIQKNSISSEIRESASQFITRSASSSPEAIPAEARRMANNYIRDRILFVIEDSGERKEVKEEVKDEVKEEVKEEVKDEVKEEVKDEVEEKETATILDSLERRYGPEMRALVQESGLDNIAEIERKIRDVYETRILEDIKISLRFIGAVPTQINEEANRIMNELIQKITTSEILRSLERRYAPEILASVQNLALALERGEANIAEIERKIRDVYETRILEDIKISLRFMGAVPAQINEEANRIMNELIQSILNRIRNVSKKEVGIAAAGLAGAALANSFISRKIEMPKIEKEHQEMDKSGGTLKPKIVIPSVEAFESTKQEYAADKAEWDAFDFIRPTSEGDGYTINENSLKKQQYINDLIRHQNAGIELANIWGGEKIMDSRMWRESIEHDSMVEKIHDSLPGMAMDLSKYESMPYIWNPSVNIQELYSSQPTAVIGMDETINKSLLYGVVV